MVENPMVIDSLWDRSPRFDDEDRVKFVGTNWVIHTDGLSFDDEYNFVEELNYLVYSDSYDYLTEKCEVLYEETDDESKGFIKGHLITLDGRVSETASWQIEDLVKKYGADFD